MTLKVNNVQVLMVTNKDGQECIALRVDGTEEVCATFTPSQARALATELITVVNRAEVKANLRVSPTPWRRTAEPVARLVAAR